MLENNLVSIITPLYNGGRFLRQTYDSVAQQTHQNWEHLIVDDGSTDDSLTVAQHIAKCDPRVRVFSMPKNSGPAMARQMGLDQSKGRFLAFLDCDDLWMPKKLEIQIAEMTRYSVPLSFSKYRRMSEDGNELGREIEIPSTVNYSELLKHNVIGTLTAMVDRKFSPPLKMVNQGYDDFILWLSVLKTGGTAIGIQQDLARYRIVGKSVSRNKIRAAKWVWNIYRNVEKLPITDAIWSFANYLTRVSLKHLKHHKYNRF